MSLRLCKTCVEEEALPRKQNCMECDLANKPVITRVAEAERRLALVPEQYRRQRVPERDWPEGRRWCSLCQTFVRLRDCPKDGSRCKTCTGISAHASRVSNLYGLSADDWNMLMNKQGGRCAICRTPPRNKRLVLDHDHHTGANRGLLCSRCNEELLSAAHHDIQILMNAVYYMQTPPLSGLWVQPEVRAGEPEPAPY